jgi:hypothetical protein
MLTVGLSTHDDITLLEREQIAKAWREQEQAASLQGNYLKLGRALSADGLLLLERRLEDNKELLVARLLAVKPGVVVTENRFVMPLADLTDWSESFSKKIKGLIPKLRVKVEDAIPISLLNLRSSVRAPENLVPETELTSLLQYCLSREPSVFVLERRRMDDLEAEKQLDAAESVSAPPAEQLLRAVREDGDREREAQQHLREGRVRHERGADRAPEFGRVRVADG